MRARNPGYIVFGIGWVLHAQTGRIRESKFGRKSRILLLGIFGSELLNPRLTFRGQMRKIANKGDMKYYVIC